MTETRHAVKRCVWSVATPTRLTAAMTEMSPAGRRQQQPTDVIRPSERDDQPRKAQKVTSSGEEHLDPMRQTQSCDAGVVHDRPAYARLLHHPQESNPKSFVLDQQRDRW